MSANFDRYLFDLKSSHGIISESEARKFDEKLKNIVSQKRQIQKICPNIFDRIDEFEKSHYQMMTEKVENFANYDLDTYYLHQPKVVYDWLTILGSIELRIKLEELISRKFERELAANNYEKCLRNKKFLPDELNNSIGKFLANYEKSTQNEIDLNRQIENYLLTREFNKVSQIYLKIELENNAIRKNLVETTIRKYLSNNSNTIEKAISEKNEVTVIVDKFNIVCELYDTLMSNQLTWLVKEKEMVVVKIINYFNSIYAFLISLLNSSSNLTKRLQDFDKRFEISVFVKFRNNHINIIISFSFLFLF